MVSDSDKMETRGQGDNPRGTHLFDGKARGERTWQKVYPERTGIGS